jgi:hypothetical protein
VNVLIGLLPKSAVMVSQRSPFDSVVGEGRYCGGPAGGPKSRGNFPPCGHC